MTVQHLVLLAEDNPDHALITTDALETVHGYDVNVVTAPDGQAALDYLGQCEGLPNLILLDIRMPRLDGFETLERLKADPVHRVIPVVMLSSSDDERDVSRSFGLGSNSYVTKPVGVDQLIERLQQIPSYWFGVNTPVEVAK